MAEGVIKRLVSERGFGFIKPVEGKDLFFHSNQLLGVVFNALKEGQKVEFDIGQGPKGPMAIRIRPFSDEPKKLPESIEEDKDLLFCAKDSTRAKRRAFRDRDKRVSTRD